MIWMYRLTPLSKIYNYNYNYKTIMENFEGNTGQDKAEKEVSHTEVTTVLP